MLDQTVVEAMVPDLPVLRMAYLIERDFAEFYEQAAQRVEDEAAQKSLSMLAQWERGHEKLFKEMHDKAFEDRLVLILYYLVAVGSAYALVQRRAIGLASVSPPRILVIGSGAIGIEFASFYNTLGADTTVVEVMDRILPPPVHRAMRDVE